MIVISKHETKRSSQLKEIGIPYIDKLFYNICDILEERGDLNLVTSTVANNIAFLEYATTQLQQDVLDRNCMVEVENGSQLFIKTNPSIAEVRQNMNSLTKFYRELKLLPEEVKPQEERDELLEFLRGGSK